MVWVEDGVFEMVWTFVFRGHILFSQTKAIASRDHVSSEQRDLYPLSPSVHWEWDVAAFESPKTGARVPALVFPRIPPTKLLHAIQSELQRLLHSLPSTFQVDFPKERLMRAQYAKWVCGLAGCKIKRDWSGASSWSWPRRGQTGEHLRIKLQFLSTNSHKRLPSLPRGLSAVSCNQTCLVIGWVFEEVTTTTTKGFQGCVDQRYHIVLYHAPSSVFPILPLQSIPLLVYFKANTTTHCQTPPSFPLPAINADRNINGKNYWQ